MSATGRPIHWSLYAGVAKNKLTTCLQGMNSSRLDAMPGAANLTKNIRRPEILPNKKTHMLDNRKLID